VLAGRRRQVLAFVLLIVGVLLSLANTNAQTELVHRRSESCDGSLPLPAGAYVLGFGGLLAGAIALIVLIRWFGRSRDGLALVLLVSASAGLIFEILRSRYQLPGGPPDLPDLRWLGTPRRPARRDRSRGKVHTGKR